MLKKLSRITENRYYLELAKTIASRSTCLRRRFGAVIVNNDLLVSTGFNSSAIGTQSCAEYGTCPRVEKNIPSGQRYEECHSIHAETRAILGADKNDLPGSTLYLVGLAAGTENVLEVTEPCMMCRRMIINAHIAKVVAMKKDTVNDKVFEVTTTREDLITLENQSFRREEESKLTISEIKECVRSFNGPIVVYTDIQPSIYFYCPYGGPHLVTVTPYMKKEELVDMVQELNEASRNNRKRLEHNPLTITTLAEEIKMLTNSLAFEITEYDDVFVVDAKDIKVSRIISKRARLDDIKLLVKNIEFNEV